MQESSTLSSFNGFPEETVKFLADLAKNNKKAWFDAHKNDYERYLIWPARAFTEALGERLTALAPGIIAEPRVNGSIFRIYRDTRFSKDKTPYKTHMGIFCWEGEGPKMECPGFYFHLQPPNLMLGGGIHLFSRPLLEEFRRSVVHPGHGPKLAGAVTKVSKSLNIGGHHYKRVPRGYDPDHPFAQFLLFNGLTAWNEGPIHDVLYSDGIVGHCFDVFRKMLPLHEWLRELSARAREARL
jgi:uncharacterized protein (TIGR02453 family)